MALTRTATVTVLALRVAYGAGLIVAPARLAKRWLGPASEHAPTQIPLRALGAREILLHAGGLAAALRGAPVRPWLAASAAGDLTDIASTLAGAPAAAPGGPPRPPGGGGGGGGGRGGAGR